MSCLLCASGNEAEFGSEILIHFNGLNNLDEPQVFVFPKLWSVWIVARRGSRFSGKRTGPSRKRRSGK